MTRVGELVLARNQVLQYASDVEDATLESTAQRLSLITSELQEDVMQTRMQPIGSVWAKFPRVVRDLSSQLGKRVKIEMEGKETELDKTIVEAIKDPLTHLVRNSVDHGIEKPEVRRAAGKPEEGILSLRAFHEGGQVNIEIMDDGAGLNIDRIRNKAVERGLVDEEEAARMDDREASQLILLPGFSTAEQVTSVSGRGVGMDVVKTNIERIGGVLDLSSQPGQGTTIKVKIPLTLAIVPALVVTNSGNRYAIPQVNVSELVRLEGDQAASNIEQVLGTPVLRLRGNLLPLVNLSQLTGAPPRQEAATHSSKDSAEPGVEEEAAAKVVVNIVVVQARDQQFGLVVDAVNDTQEIVVKPLSRQLGNIPDYAGATIMGDGTIAMILDVTGLAGRAGLAKEKSNQISAFAGATDGTIASSDVQSLLLVDTDDTRRFALQTSLVSRLETVRRTSIELADGREVVQYRGSILPLVRLEKVAGSPTASLEHVEELKVVVCSDDDRSFGLIVNRIIDTTETQLDFHARAAEDHYLLGTVVIQDRVTDVLNLPHLLRAGKI